MAHKQGGSMVASPAPAPIAGTSYRDTLLRLQASSNNTSSASLLTTPTPLDVAALSRSLSDTKPNFIRSSSRKITFADEPELLQPPAAAARTLSESRLGASSTTPSHSILVRKTPVEGEQVEPMSSSVGRKGAELPIKANGAGAGGEGFARSDTMASSFGKRSGTTLLDDSRSSYTSERLRLLSLMQDMGPLALYNSLVSQLASLEGDSERRRVVQGALSVIFPPQKRELPKEVMHCRRCHQSYDPNRNLSGDCKVAHSDSPSNRHELVKKSNEQTVWKLGCCGMKIFAPPSVVYIQPTEEHGFCYQGTHAAEEDEVEWYNMVTIFRCNGGKSEGGKACSRKAAVGVYGT